MSKKIHLTIDATADNWDELHQLLCHIDNFLSGWQGNEDDLTQKTQTEGPQGFGLYTENHGAKITLGMRPGKFSAQDFLNDATTPPRPNGIRAGELGDTP